MPRAFLPPAVEGASHPVQPVPGGFFEAGPDLLSHVGTHMDVSEAQTEGRVPTPLSRAYMFYTALFGRSLAMSGNVTPGFTADGRPEDSVSGAGRRALQTQARATFRGLCTLFALREALGLRIELETIEMVPNDDLFARLLLPTLRSAPGRPDFWRPMRLFTVASGEGRPEVLGGLSPLTGLFPAANAPRAALAGLYWYEPPVEANDDGLFLDAQGREVQPMPTWHDPTGDAPMGDVPLAPRARAAVRGALARWLAAVLEAWTDEGLAATGLTTRAAALLKAEFVQWSAELATDTTAAAHVSVVPLDLTATGLPPFLNLVCRGVDETIRSDFPVYGGRLFVHKGALLDPRRRLWGRVQGQRTLAAKVDGLPAQGDNLGRALGLGDRAAPTPFVFVDRLFTPTFTVLASAAQTLSPEWKALRVANGDTTEWALYPFRKEVLEVFSPETLAESTTARFTQEDNSYLVTLTLDGRTVTQRYTSQGEDGYKIDDLLAPDQLDLRLFPNIDLHAPDVERLLPADDRGARPDQAYHLRVRRSPMWTFAIRPFSLQRADPAAVDGDGAPAAARPTVVMASSPYRDPRRRTEGTAGSEGPFPPGPVDVYTLDRAPTGVLVEDRGLCFVQLRPPPKAGGVPVPWELAVDFGTSNTCVVYNVIGTGDSPRPLDLPVLTTTLLHTPQYGELVGVNEGQSAALDFFFRVEAADKFLLGPGGREEQPTYFPTQIATTQDALNGSDSGSFGVENGLILFRNVNLTGFELPRLIQGFNTETFDTSEKVRPVEKRFRVEQDIKWERREWMRAFMAHLRRQIVLAAAYENAEIKSVTFSYPKAFGSRERTNFRTVLGAVWGDRLEPLVSESEAVRSLLGTDATQNVVLDIGGGTTDLIGFAQKVPTFQTSFKLAAETVTKYVLKSKGLRELFLAAAQETRALKSRSAASAGKTDALSDLFVDGPELQVRNAWHGILQAIETNDPNGGRFEELLAMLIPNGASAEDVRAVQGLMLTTALMFGGTAFLAGRLQREAASGAYGTGFTLTSVRIRLTGNGSKLYRFLSPERRAFDRVMVSLFKRGLGEAHASVPVEFEGIYRTPDGRLAPKTTVALGMLTARNADAAPIPVANIVGERFEGVEPTAELGAFYRRIVGEGRNFVPPEAAPPELSAFLDAFGELVPRGYVGDVEVIPKLAAGWAERIKTETYGRVRSDGLLNRLWRNADEATANDDGADGSGIVTAYEPVFIAQLVALIEQICEEYA